jgi:hypothetical protein
MLGLTKNRDALKNQNEEQQKARDRMALLPSRADVLFVDEELWVVGASPHATTPELFHFLVADSEVGRKALRVSRGSSLVQEAPGRTATLPSGSRLV